MGNSSMFNPENYGVGTGLIDDVDFVVKDACVTNFDYNGTQVPVPAVKFVLTVDGEDVDQYWSAGKNTDWAPSEDGKKLIPIGKATQLNATSNVAILFSSIINAGFPVDKIDDDVTCMIGLEGHMIRVPAPKRNLKKSPRADGKEYDPTILTVASISKLPWENTKPSGKSSPAANKGKSTPATSAPANEAAPSGGDLEEKTTGILMDILSENEDGITKKQLPTLIFKKAMKDPDKNAMVQLAFKDEFLSSGPWSYEGGTIKLG